MRNAILLVFNLIICLMGLMAPSLADIIVIVRIQIIGDAILLINPKSGKYFSTGLVFFLMLCVFHYGRFLFSSEYTFTAINDSLLFQSIRFTVVMLSAIVIGYSLCVGNQKKDITISKVDLDEVTLEKIRKISLLIIVLTIIPLFYIDFIKIQYSLANGYVGINTIGNENLFIKYASTFTTFTRPAVLLLILSYYRFPKKARNTLLIFCAFSFLEMLSGSRAISMIYISASLMLYYRLFKLKGSSIIIFSLFLLLIIYIMPSITAVRQDSYSIEDVVTASAVASAESGQFELIMSEFGGTMISVAYAMQFTSSFNYGLTYIVGLINISPKIPQWLLPVISDDLTYTNSFPSAYQYTLGGSCIGEAYYNFGWFAPLFALLLGYIIAKVDIGLCLVSKRNIFKVIAIITCLPFLLLWVRGFFCSMIFPLFWVPLLYRYYLKRVS